MVTCGGPETSPFRHASTSCSASRPKLLPLLASTLTQFHALAPLEQCLYCPRLPESSLALRGPLHWVAPSREAQRHPRRRWRAGKWRRAFPVRRLAQSSAVDPCVVLLILRLTVRPQVNSERTHWPRGTAYIGQDRQPVGGGAGRQVFCLPIFPSADTSSRQVSSCSSAPALPSEAGCSSCVQSPARSKLWSPPPPQT